MKMERKDGSWQAFLHRLGPVMAIIFTSMGLALLAMDVTIFSNEGSIDGMLTMIEAGLLAIGASIVISEISRRRAFKVQEVADDEVPGWSGTFRSGPSTGDAALWGSLDMKDRLDLFKEAGFSGPIAVRWSMFGLDDLPQEVRKEIGDGLRRAGRARDGGADR